MSSRIEMKNVEFVLVDGNRHKMSRRRSSSISFARRTNREKIFFFSSAIEFTRIRWNSWKTTSRTRPKFQRSLLQLNKWVWFSSRCFFVSKNCRSTKSTSTKGFSFVSLFLLLDPSFFSFAVFDRNSNWINTSIISASPWRNGWSSFGAKFSVESKKWSRKTKAKAGIRTRRPGSFLRRRSRSVNVWRRFVTFGND